MTTRKGTYAVPALKVTKEGIRDPQQLLTALQDYSKDMQSFLQQFIVAFNTNNQGYDASISTLQDLAPNALTGTGYFTLPNGVIIQWMQGSADDPGVSNLLPKAFPNSIWAAWASIDSTAVPTQDIAVSLTDTSHVTLTASAAGSVNCFLLAIGK